MNSTKSILMSKTFWGAIFALIAAVDPTLYTKILGWVNISDPTLLSAKIIGLFGAIFAIYGRMAATQLVTVTGKPSGSSSGMIKIPPAK